MSQIQALIDSEKFHALYRAQGLFPRIRKTQKKQDISVITHAWVDLDIYKLQNTPEGFELWKIWADNDDPGRVSFLLGECMACGLPLPSEVIFSGGGAYMLWEFTDPVFIRRKRGQPVGKTYIGIIERINKAIQQKLIHLSADPVPVSADSILRIPGSINYKYGSGTPCRMVYRNPANRMSSDDLKTSLLGRDQYTPEQKVIRFEAYKEIERKRKKAFRESQKKYDEQGRKWAEERLQKDIRQNHAGSNVIALFGDQVKRPAKHSPARHSNRIVADLRTLARLRWSDGIVGKGCRDIFGHLAVSACSGHFREKPERLLDYVAGQIADFMPADYMKNEFRPHNRNSVKMLENAGEKTSGRKNGLSDSHYAYTIDRIIQVLDISIKEMETLKCLVSDSIKKERRKQADRKYQADKRRKAGAVDRDTYENTSLNKERPWEVEGISRASWYRREKKVRKIAVIRLMAEVG
ncbi:hypothetical protein [Acetobacter aceti]|uniref:Replication protein n=1 Tax=Acetobacter aceti TaxID=435 RepID=A0A6S6PF42_ACEAC|nr:hypothetical protein [Acetobacter aceti]BCI65883.1 hypothetical protein AAJCM20276_05070 [Acetobacter aceti]